MQTLVDAGLVRRKALVKILGQGTLPAGRPCVGPRLLQVGRGGHHRCRGSIERVPLPYAHGRPPASGNALMNR